MKIYSILLSIAVFLIITACPSGLLHDHDLDRLVENMTGTFNSSAQAEADSNYYDITLHMYPIWEGVKNFRCLYVEQAVSSMQDKPYRQRIYVISRQIKGRYSSRVFTLPEPERFVGKWNDSTLFASITVDSLIERSGCTVYLETQEDGSFKGSTVDQDCTSSLRGASYATSSVEVYDDRIISWDQGWDSTGTQVWGATEGGYVFVRQE